MLDYITFIMYMLAMTSKAALTHYIVYFQTNFQALQKGNIEGARIHAENAIRQKNQVQCGRSCSTV